MLDVTKISNKAANTFSQIEAGAKLIISDLHTKLGSANSYIESLESVIKNLMDGAANTIVNVTNLKPTANTPVTTNVFSTVVTDIDNIPHNIVADGEGVANVLVTEIKAVEKNDVIPVENKIELTARQAWEASHNVTAEMLKKIEEAATAAARNIGVGPIKI